MSMFHTAMFLETMESLQKAVHQNSKDKGFWGPIPKCEDPHCHYEKGHYGPHSSTREVTELESVPVKIALIHSEVSEMLEAYRVGNPPSGKINDIRGAEAIPFSLMAEEMADVIIRVMDLAEWMRIDLGRAVLAKAEYNSSRPHKHW